MSLSCTMRFVFWQEGGLYGRFEMKFRFLELSGFAYLAGSRNAPGLGR